MDAATLVLEYVRLLLSAPVVCGLIALVALIVFKPDIKTLIDRIATIKFPGGSELSTSQRSRSTEEASQQAAPDVPDSEQIPLSSDIQLTQDQQIAVNELYRAERANAYLWEYRYLNYFLVLTTQGVLDWIATNQQPTSVSLFDNFWAPLIPSTEERNAIIDALQSHHLIMLSDGLIRISPKGQEYIDWRGPLKRAAI